MVVLENIQTTILRKGHFEKSDSEQVELGSGPNFGKRNKLVRNLTYILLTFVSQK